MPEIILVVVATSVLTALCTAVFVLWFYNRKIRPQLEAQLEQAGETMQARVRQGVLDAGEELLPKFREKVTEGFTRALAEWPSSEMTRMARSGANLVGEGLNTLLGKKRE